MGFLWEQGQQNRITFVMVDAAGSEVSGLGGALTIEISKNGGAFAAAGGSQAEISDGWYTYLSTVSEANTPGTVSVKVTGAGAVQQNLEYVVKTRVSAATDYTYTVTDAALSPLDGVTVEVSTDAAKANIVFIGTTDAFGVLRDSYGNLPLLDPGSSPYYFWLRKRGYSFDNPDTETVS